MFSSLSASKGRSCILLFALLLAAPSNLLSDDPDLKDPDLFGAGKTAIPEKSPVIDGSFVHNIGRLQMNTSKPSFAYLNERDAPRNELNGVRSSLIIEGNGPLLHEAPSLALARGELCGDEDVNQLGSAGICGHK